MDFTLCTTGPGRHLIVAGQSNSNSDHPLDHAKYPRFGQDDIIESLELRQSKEYLCKT